MVLNSVQIFGVQPVLKQQTVTVLETNESNKSTHLCQGVASPAAMCVEKMVTVSALGVVKTNKDILMIWR